MAKRKLKSGYQSKIIKTAKAEYLSPLPLLLYLYLKARLFLSAINHRLVNPFAVVFNPFGFFLCGLFL